jgi:hypothetical protein
MVSLGGLEELLKSVCPACGTLRHCSGAQAPGAHIVCCFLQPLGFLCLLLLLRFQLRETAGWCDTCYECEACLSAVSMLLAGKCTLTSSLAVQLVGTCQPMGAHQRAPRHHPYPPPRSRHIHCQPWPRRQKLKRQQRGSPQLRERQRLKRAGRSHQHRDDHADTNHLCTANVGCDQYLARKSVALNRRNCGTCSLTRQSALSVATEQQAESRACPDVIQPMFARAPRRGGCVRGVRWGPQKLPATCRIYPALVRHRQILRVCQAAPSASSVTC